MNFSLSALIAALTALRVYPPATPGSGGSGTVESIGAGSGIDVDNTDPANPVVSAEARLPTTGVAVFDGTSVSLQTDTGLVAFAGQDGVEDNAFFTMSRGGVDDIALSAGTIDSTNKVRQLNISPGQVVLQNGEAALIMDSETETPRMVKGLNSVPEPADVSSPESLTHKAYVDGAIAEIDLSGKQNVLTTTQRAVFTALGLTLPDSVGPMGTAITIPYTETSPVSFVEALDLATALAVHIPVQFEIDGIIPEADIAPGYEHWLYGDLMNLSIIGKQSNTGSLLFNSVVSCNSVGGGRFDLVLQQTNPLPLGVTAGSMVLFETSNSSGQLPAAWYGVAGAYLVKSVDRANNRVTLDFANPTAIPTGAMSLGAGAAFRYCGNILPNVLFRIRANIRQMGNFGINGGNLLTQTESHVRADGVLAVIPASGQIAFDIGGAFGGYVNSLKLFAGTKASNLIPPYLVMENPGSTSLVNLSGIYANNFDTGISPHDGAQLVISLDSAFVNMATAGITVYSYSDVYLSYMRLHNMPSGVEVFAGGKVYIGSQIADTDVTTLYGTTPGTLQADGSGIFDINFSAPPTGGTVTSVGLSVPTGLQVADSPVTTSGELAVTLAPGYVIPTQTELDGKVNATDFSPTPGLVGAVELTDEFIGLRAGVPYKKPLSSLPTGSMTAAQIRDALETLTTTERLDASAVQNLPEGGADSSLGLWDFWYDYRISTTGAAAGDMFVGAAISGGNNNTALTSSGLTGMSGYNTHGVFLRSGATANGGYKYQTTSLVGDFFGAISHKFRAQFLWRTSFTGRTLRIGYHNTTTSADATNGAYFEIVDDVCTAKTASLSDRTSNATTLTLSLDVAYTFDIAVNAAGTSARFRVYSGTSQTPLLDVTNTANLPSNISSLFGAGIVATESSTTASDIGILYYLGVGTVEGFNRARGEEPPPAPTAPAALTADQWTAEATVTPGEMGIDIVTLPSDGGSGITALEYRVNGGTAIALTGTGTGLRVVTAGFTAGTAVDIEVRAVNAVDANPANWSDVKNRTPLASGGSSIATVGVGTPYSTVSALTAHPLTVPSGLAEGHRLVVLMGDFADATSVVASNGQLFEKHVREVGAVWSVVIEGDIPTGITVNFAVATDFAATTVAFSGVGGAALAGLINTEVFEPRPTIPYNTDAPQAAVIVVYAKGHPDSATAALFNGVDAADYLYKLEFTPVGFITGIHDGPTGTNDIDVTWSSVDTGGRYISVAFKP